MTNPHREIALACRILANAGLAEGVLGHVSMRTSADRLLVRCRGPQEEGLLFTSEEDVHEVGLDDEELPDDYQVPNELPIHREVLRARPEVGAVVHVHPPAVVASDLVRWPLRPVIGAYNIPAMRMAHDGIPVYPRSVLIRRKDLGEAMVAAMGDKPICVLRGHGIVSTGDDVRHAVARALDLDALARLTLQLRDQAGTIPAISDADLDELPDLGSGFNNELVWQHQIAKLRHEGLNL